MKSVKIAKRDEFVKCTLEDIDEAVKYVLYGEYLDEVWDFTSAMGLVYKNGTCKLIDGLTECIVSYNDVLQHLYDELDAIEEKHLAAEREALEKMHP